MTPLKRVSSRIYAKLELLNLGGSHKVRAAKQMILDLTRDRQISQQTVLLEKTGGNLGIGLAMEAAKYSLRLHLVVNLDFSEHKKNILRNMGVKLVGIEKLQQGLSTLETIKELLAEQSEEYIYLDQFNNPSNLKAHLIGTGPELLGQIESTIRHSKQDIWLVGGIGTGASLGGTLEIVRTQFRQTRVATPQPPGVDFLKAQYPKEHGIYGTGVTSPTFLSLTEVDRFVDCDYTMLTNARMRLFKETGILCGPSSAANMAIAYELESETTEFSDPPNIYTFIYDGGESYL